jgi:hypothetical protein
MIRESSQKVRDGLAAALAAYGVPEQILTDIQGIHGEIRDRAWSGAVRPDLRRQPVAHRPKAFRCTRSDLVFFGFSYLRFQLPAESSILLTHSVRLEARARLIAVR